ncbi:thioredoxin family protein [Butyricimonas sp. Marseille-P3923]|uniref:thioredoxin family protein n=1 Tax=Butyricimonas sp. Marseille-P3923 TaxID=1987504 RepID=UPI000C069D9B|nr:thioredoxin family protein [Butyricimonas sp. Marseille-P3923]
MKSLISIITLLIFSFTVFGQGVNFEHLTFDEALAKAKAENKLIFMDCYIIGCGPCKYMSEKVFTQEKAGVYFNPKFICVKFDMGKGEGPTLAKRFEVKAYPTFLIIHPDGNIQHKIVGGGELEDFIPRVEKGLHEKTSLSYLTKLHEKKKMNKKQLIDYQIALLTADEKEKSANVAEELATVLKDKDKLQKKYWTIIENDGYGSSNFKFVVANVDRFKKNVGKDKVDAYLYNNYNKAIDNCTRWGAKEPQVQLTKIRQELLNLGLEKQDRLINKVDLIEATLNKDVEKVISVISRKKTNADIFSVMSALYAIKSKATKEQLERIAILGNKFIENAAPGREKADLETIFEDFRIAAHTGIYFQELTYEQALAKAKQQRKRLFIDCYTSWCGPCQYMANKVFTQKNVGDFFNKNFICVKYDMEKGEGPELGKKFGVRAYPTFVIVNPDGSIRHKLVGGGEGEEFIKRVEESFDDEKALGTSITKYNEGNRDKAFLASYAQTLLDLYDPAAKDVANELFVTLSDEEKVSPDYWFIFDRKELSPKGSDAEKFLLANRAKFNATIGKEVVDTRLSKDLQQELMEILATKGQAIKATRFDEITKEVKSLKLSNEKSLLGLVAIGRAVKDGNVDRFLATCEKEMPKVKADKRLLNYYLSQLTTRGTDAQKARWKKIADKYL